MKSIAVWLGSLALLGATSVPCWSQETLEQRVARLERQLQEERQKNRERAAESERAQERIRELELTCVSLRETIDVVENDTRLEDEVEAIVKRHLGEASSGRSESRVSFRGRSRLAWRAFGNENLSSDQSFEVEHFILQIDVDLGEGTRFHLAPGLSHSGAWFLISGYVESEITDWLQLRLGRFLVPFGGVHAWAFPSDTFIEPYLGDNSPRPFMYAPYWDEGLMARGTTTLDEGSDVTLNYAAWIVNGYDEQGLGGIHKRSLGDNNENKTVGGRLSVGFRLGDEIDLSVGGSFSFGKYDPDDRLAFYAVEADVELQAGDFSLYLEFFHRPMEVEATVAENPAATVREVSRLNGFKLRPRYQLFESLALYAQADWLYTRQPPRQNGQWSVFSLSDQEFAIRTYVFGVEYALRERVLLNVEVGIFDRDPDLGGDIPFLSVAVTTSF